MKIVVTGSAGLVGGVLCPALASAGHDVVPFDLRDRGYDILDPVALAKAVRACDGIIHLAAVSRVAWGEADPALCMQVNVDGTEAVVKAAEAAPRKPWVILASSREIYGVLATLPARESDPVAPLNTYGRSKAGSEAAVLRANARGLRTAILRLSNVYGSVNDHPDRAVPSLLWRAMQGLELRITGGGTFFDFVHVDDCVEGFIAAVERLDRGESVEPLHFVTGIATTLSELAEVARRVAASSSPIIVDPARSFDVSGFVGDPARAAEVLGWQAHIALEAGVQRLRADLVRRGCAMGEAVMPIRSVGLSGQATKPRKLSAATTIVPALMGRISTN